MQLTHEMTGFFIPVESVAAEGVANGAERDRTADPLLANHLDKKLANATNETPQWFFAQFAGCLRNKRYRKTVQTVQKLTHGINRGTFGAALRHPFTRAIGAPARAFSDTKNSQKQTGVSRHFGAFFIPRVKP